MIVKPATGEKALWVTERSQLPTGEWRIMVWLNTKDSLLSHKIHEDVAKVVKNWMTKATDPASENKTAPQASQEEEG